MLGVLSYSLVVSLETFWIVVYSRRELEEPASRSKVDANDEVFHVHSLN